ncbi:ACP S-malonyltransferase [bacterium]|nr:ACP S-malonyltransferase [bacterium]
MNNFSIIFPGQGSQKSGMGKDLYDNFDCAKAIFDTADRVIGRKISDICFNGSEEELVKTVNSQPCILTVEIAALEVLKENTNIEIVAFAGHSLGEYAALYAAGVVDLETVFLLINKRAELMNKAAKLTDGSMAAVIGLDDETVKNIVNNLENVYVANYNCNGQVVITGEKTAINNNLDKFKAAGARKVIPLSVSGAFHSPYMKEVAEEFTKYLNQFNLKDSKYPVYTNVDAKLTTSADEFKEKLPKQIFSSVHWTQTINNIISSGCNQFIEAGNGKVLAGLNKKINPEIITYNIYDIESLNLFIQELNNKEKELV